MPTCLICESSRTVKNVHIHNGKQRFKYQNCGQQFIEQAAKKVIDQTTWELIDRLLLEWSSLAGIDRSTKVSDLNNGSANLRQREICSGARSVQATPKKKGG